MSDAGFDFCPLEGIDFLLREGSLFPGAGVFRENLQRAASVRSGLTDGPGKTVCNGKMGSQQAWEESGFSDFILWVLKKRCHLLHFCII